MWYKVVGYYLYLHINRWSIFQMGLLLGHLQAVPHVHLQSWNSNAHRKSTYILKIKIKCYKSNVYRLVSYMSHVFEHVHTCIHFIQYLLQFSPYFSYKLYLNTVYKYSITIPIYMLPLLSYPKAGKNRCV